jgi:hypothetical protein
MSIKEIIQQLRVTMDDARGQESHFDSWLTQNEGICQAIDSLKILDTTPAAQRPWQGLTEEDWDHIDNTNGTSQDTFIQGAAWAAARLKERNT